MDQVRTPGPAAPVRPPLPLIWLRELRAPFFTGTLGPIAFGAAYAHFQGSRVDSGLFALTLLGGLLVHAGLNMANDYFDARHGGDDLTVATPVSGGSKVIQEGLLKAPSVLLASVACLVLGAAVGLYLNFRVGGNVLLAAGAVGLVFAWFYTAPPLKLGHRGGTGEIACTLGFGPVMAFGAYYVQAGRFSWSGLVAGLPIGILMGLVLFINEFQDVSADRAVGKNTLVVTLGPRVSATVFVLALASAYALTAGLVLARVFPGAALFVFASAPLAWFAAARARSSHSDLKRLLPANFAVIGLHLLFSAVLTVSLL
jgi:1,4-dihydroxy-2-naphthoate octaprenyltransferase